MDFVTIIYWNNAIKVSSSGIVYLNYISFNEKHPTHLLMVQTKLSEKSLAKRLLVYNVIVGFSRQTLLQIDAL